MTPHFYLNHLTLTLKMHLGSNISTANNNYRAAAAFPRSHTVAVTYVRVAARRILNLWRQKTCGCRTAFEVMHTVALGRPCGGSRVYTNNYPGQPHGKPKATVCPTYGRRGTALRHGYDVSNCLIAMVNLEIKKVITLHYNPSATPTSCKR